MRAATVTHVEYELLRHILDNVDVADVRDNLVTDKISEKRFVQGGANVMQLIENLAERRRHRLPPKHDDYQAKEVTA